MKLGKRLDVDDETRGHMVKSFKTGTLHLVFNFAECGASFLDWLLELETFLEL